MKKVALSALAAAMMSGVAYADTLTLYTDPKTGQVFTTAGEGRVEMGDFISAKDVDMQLRDQESKLSEYQDKQSKYVNVKSKAKTLEFSGTHYFGYTNARPDNVTGAAATYPANSGGFELRRNYVQVKGYFNDKDYWRVTFDATKELTQGEDSGSDNHGYASAFVKYAYLYLDKVLPYTGVEFGIAHRPWIDYEEHNGWYYRSFNKVVLEEKGTGTEAGVDLVNSADLGVNFKTKTDMFSSEIGIFNGEGYHADKGGANQENDEKLSLEWRLTGHLIGSGEKVGKNDRTKDTYAHISTYGLISKNHKDDSATLDQTSTSTTDPLKVEYDRSFYGIHAVYNQPEFLIAAQYAIAKDDIQDPTKFTGAVKFTERNYDVWSVNAEFRPFQDWTVIGRYDDYKIEHESTNQPTYTAVEGNKIIAALAYKYNKNVSFIGSAKFIDEDRKTYTNAVAADESKDVYMLTTEVKW
ncbi:MAG: hypothetical protein PHV10_06560 [Sulfuricurvum sp.]|nr:hypothetical protein [Sulfuricurvum sp.]